MPEGVQLRAAAMSRLRTWAGYLDPDFAHSQRVSQLAILLYDGLIKAGALARDSSEESREVLQAAAFMHDVGKVKGREDHQKNSFRMIRKLARPMGWSARELELSAVVARYHRGALPRPRGKSMQRLDLPDRRIALQLAGVLRLSNALDTRNGNHPRIDVQVHDDFVLVRAA